MRRGVGLTPMETRRDIIVRAAALADELGYEIFSVAEGWALDSTVLLAELATKTRRITLMAGVLSVWGRSPATIAMAATTLHQLCGGRFILGLGASSPQLTEGWHDVVYHRPAARLRDTTAQVRALLDGHRATLSANPTARPLRLGQPPTPDLPIWLAAAGDRTLRVTADLADGWNPIYLCRDRIRELAAAFSQRPVTVAAGPLTIVDPDLSVARAAAAATTATYLAAMGDIYPRLVAAQGFAAEVDLVRSTRTVPEEAHRLLAEFTAHGPEPTVQDQLAHWDTAVDITMIGLPPGLPWPQIEATLHAAAPRPAAIPQPAYGPATANRSPRTSG